jgi:hypothetical protein
VSASPLRAETWEKQAERLQNVSAAMVDDLPFAEMPMGLKNITIKANVSLLPKTNATVGGKSESVPSSPVHTVPTLQGDLLIEPLAGWSTGVRLWAGYLPAGSEKLVHLKAAIHQSVYGVSWMNRFRMRAVEPGFELGVQKGSATIKGAITASDADDEFKATTQLTYVALGFRIPAWRIWSTLLLAKRRVESEFNIPADQTSLHLVDTLDDSSPAMAAQVAVGVDLAKGLQLGLGQVIVPKRVTMTRLLIGWKVAL